MSTISTAASNLQRVNLCQRVRRAGRRHQRVAATRGQLRYLSAVADHSAAKPGPALPARHQPVHPTTGRVRRGRATDQHEHQHADADFDAADLRGYLGAAAGRLHRHGQRQHRRALQRDEQSGHVEPHLVDAGDRPSHDYQFRRDRPPIPDRSRSTPERQSFTWNGQGNNGQTWPDGTYKLTISATSANGQAVDVSTQVQGVVSGVNLSARTRRRSR